VYYRDREWERVGTYMTGAHKNEGFMTLGIDKRLVNDGMNSI